MELGVKNRSGFTLIELLVVIAIIALLLAILLPSLNKVKEKAKELVCKTHLRGIGLGMKVYIEENDGKVYPRLANRYMWYEPDPPNQGDEIGPDHLEAYWGVAYRDYIESTKVFGCPSLQRQVGSIYPATVPAELLKEAAYAINHSIIDFDKVAEIKSPSFFIVCHDHQEPKIENESADHFHNDGPGTMNVRQYRVGSDRPERIPFYPTLFRHSKRFGDPDRTGGNADILWLDNHVSSLAETTGDDVPRRWYDGK